jgi:protein AbiQ
MSKLKLVHIDENYINYLHQHDHRVLKGKNRIGNDKIYPYVGVLVNRNEKNYFAPLQSPKEKYTNIKDSQKNVFKISKDSKYGIISLINMIPVTESSIKEISLENYDSNYKNLLLNQINCIEKNKTDLLIRANYVIDLCYKKPNHYLVKNAVDIPLLSNVSDLYEVQNEKNKFKKIKKLKM